MLAAKWPKSKVQAHQVRDSTGERQMSLADEECPHTALDSLHRYSLFKGLQVELQQHCHHFLGQQRSQQYWGQLTCTHAGRSSTWKACAMPLAMAFWMRCPRQRKPQLWNGVL